MNDDTFEERFSLKLTPLGFFTLNGTVIIAFIILIISLIAFTPLREYIPGYADVNMRRQLIYLTSKLDSIEQDMESKNIYIQNLNDVISGKTIPDPEAMKKDSTLKYNEIDAPPSKEDSALRAEIEAADKYSLSTGENTEVKNGISSFIFFTPVKGLVTSSFNFKEEHLGVDVAAPENSSIKATLDGTIIYSGWTADGGYLIQIQHSHNLVSVYKHNSALMKKTGQFVKAGEVIAIIGNSGELTTGPHLHFELWYNGNAVNPQEYMVF